MLPTPIGAGALAAGLLLMSATAANATPSEEQARAVHSAASHASGMRGSEAPAHAGSLDWSFGDAGLSIHDLAPDDAVGSGVALDHHGRSILVGSRMHQDSETSAEKYEVIVQRRTADGQLDRSFADAGTKRFSVNPDPDGSSKGRQVEVDEAGRIVIGASAVSPSAEQEWPAFVRLTDSGDFDRSFGSGGVALREEAGPAMLRGFTFDAERRLIFTTDESLVGRLTTSGAFDHSFGKQGTVEVPDESFVGKPIIDSKGRIVAPSTNAEVTPDQIAPTLVRLTADGALDPKFGKNGHAVIKFPSTAGAKGYVVRELANGKLIVGGQSQRWIGEELAPRMSVAAMTPSGAMDRTFGNGGTTIFEPEENSAILDLRVDDQQRIVVGGTANGTNPEIQGRFTIARLTTSGHLDEAFGDHGVTKTSVPLGEGDGYAQINGIAIDQQGRIVAGGQASSALAVARYLAR